MYRPVMWVTVLFLAGILSCRYDNVSLILIFPITAFFVVSVRFFHDKGHNSFIVLVFLLFSVSSFFIGKIIAGNTQAEDNLEKYSKYNQNKNIDIFATVTDISKSNDMWKLKAEAEETNGSMIIYSKEAYEYGDLLKFSAELKQFSTPMNDGEADMKSYYAARGIFCYAKPETIEIIKKNNKKHCLMHQKIIDFRLKFINRLNMALDEENVGTLSAMLAGDRTMLSGEVKDRYQKAGFSHVLAISGLHVSVIALFVWLLLCMFGAGKNMSTVISLIFLCLYAVFCGAAFSVIRAVIMLSFSFTAKRLGRNYDPLTALCFAAFIIASGNPGCLYDSSFILSFSAALFAWISSKTVKALFKDSKERKLIKKLKSSFVFVFLMQLMVLPLQLYFFYSFSPFGLILNFVLLPLMSVLVVAGFLCGLSSLTAGFAAFPVKLILGLYYDSCGFVNNLPFGRIICGKPYVLRILAAYVLIFVIIIFIRKYKSIRVMSFGLCIPLIFIGKNKGSDGFYQLYVGQGDCGIILNDGKAVMIDCGSSDKEGIYSHTVEKFLNYHGYERPDLIFLSHADVDHTNGVKEMLGSDLEEKRGNDTVIFLPGLKDMSSFDVVNSLADLDESTEVMQITSGEVVKVGELELIMLFPDEDAGQESDNENSMVLYVRKGDFTALYTGDISATEERKVVEKMEEFGLDKDIDLLKAAHHGSRFSNSEELLEALSPDQVFISAGIGNPYGHPAEETIKRLIDAGCEVHVTAEEGELSVPE